MEKIFEKKNTEENNFIWNKSLLDIEYNEKTLHQLITSYKHNTHIGIKKQKNRSEVSGGGKKPWRQKGTGRARAGSIRSPIWKGGGKIFAAKGIERRKKKINKKMYKLGLKIILSQLIKDNRISIIENLELNESKTKTFLNKITYVKNKENCTFIVEEINKNLYLATRNLKNFSIILYKKINPVILLKSKKIFITKSGIKLLEEHLK